MGQDEIISSSGQVEPPGMHMIYLPYSDDIRHVEEACRVIWPMSATYLILANYSFWFNLQLHRTDDAIEPRATDDQIKKASALMRRIDLKDFSVCQFANPGFVQIYIIELSFFFILVIEIYFWCQTMFLGMLQTCLCSQSPCWQIILKLKWFRIYEF